MCLKYVPRMPRVKEGPQTCLRLCVLKLCQVTLPFYRLKADSLIIVLGFFFFFNAQVHHSFMMRTRP